MMSAWTKRSEHRSGFKSLCLTAQQADVRLTIRKGASAQSETCQKPKNLQMLREKKWNRKWTCGRVGALASV